MNLYFESAGMIVTLIDIGKYLEARAKGKTSTAIEKLMDLAPKQLRSFATVSKRSSPSKNWSSAMKSSSVRAKASRPTVSFPKVQPASTNRPLPVKVFLSKNRLATRSRRLRSIKRASSTSKPSASAPIRPSARSSTRRRSQRQQGAYRQDGRHHLRLLRTGRHRHRLNHGYRMVLRLRLQRRIRLLDGYRRLGHLLPLRLGPGNTGCIMVGTGKGAENGILIKSGEALETAHAIDTVVMDKTGTITEGRPKVTDIIALTGSDEELVTLAAALEKGSEHPCRSHYDLCRRSQPHGQDSQ